MAKIQSNQITFVDITDSRKFDVYISSNLPTTQIYNSNTGAYSPDWRVSNLKLTADIYLDSEKITTSNVQWSTKINGVKSPAGSGASLTINTNVLSSNPIITYICETEYQGLKAFSEITFMRADTGKDGTSIDIKGSYDTVADLKAAHPIGMVGDSYIIKGDLYVWSADDSDWVDVGNLQGPKGDKGDSAKNIILSADSQVFKVDKDGIISPTKIKVTAQNINTDISNWTYSTDGGLLFTPTVPSGVVKTGNQISITGTSLTSNSLVIKASDGEISDTLTIYKAYDGVKGSDGTPAPIVFLTNENITFGADDKGQISSTSFNTSVVAYKGVTKVTPTIESVTGLPNGMTYTSSTSGNEITLSFTIADNSTLGSTSSNNGTITIPVTNPVNTNLKLSWSKVNSGTNGVDGDSGSDAYTVVLTNESNTFAGDVENAIPSSTSTQVLAYKGTAPQSVTIVSVNGMNASINSTATGITGLRFKCSALSGTSPTITFTCTTDFKGADATYQIAPIGSSNFDIYESYYVKEYTDSDSYIFKQITIANASTYITYDQSTDEKTLYVKRYLGGSIPIVLSVDGITFTKMFTYSIAFKGGKGETGQSGAPASSYWLISSANVVHKTSTGTIAVTPSTLTFTGRRQTGAESPTNYACRWKIAYSNDGVNYTDLYTTSTVDEASKSITVLTTYKTIRVRMYMAGSTTTLIDEQIIPVVSDGATGPRGVDGITFQVYSATGYIISNEIPTLTLQTFAYDGSTEITSGATYQWSQYVDDIWIDISEATTKTLAITKGDVLKAKSYKCTMTYKSKQYVATVTVQDKTDIYNSIMCISSNETNNNCYWVLYTLVYSDTEEVDPLLGSISAMAPTSPVNGDYWYAVDTTNATVTLKKYNGTSWVNSTDTQLLSYYWDIINDGSAQVPLGASSKVKVVSCHDFTATATLVCEVSNIEDGLLTQSSLSITDASDPIVSETEPIATVNGQIWIKPNGNGTYLMFVWDASLNNWISSDMDTRNKVYTSRPSSYNAGDLWITASDTDHGSYLHGTLLQAQKSNTTYNATDWSPTLRYDQDIDNMKETLNNLAQYVTITSAGLRIGARSVSGELSPFTSLFTSTELSFYQNSEKLLTLANNQLTAPRIVVEEDLEVQGSISLGDLKIIIESNGSFSFAIQK